MTRNERPPLPLWRTTLFYGAAFALCLLFSGFAIYYVAIRSLSAHVDARLKADSRDILGGNGDMPLSEIERRLAERRWRERGDDLAYVLFDGSGRLISGNVRLSRLREGFSDVEYTGDSGKPDLGRAFAVRRRDGSMLVLVADDAPVEHLVSALIRIGLLSVSVTIVIGVIAGMAMTASISRRLDATTRTAESIVAGDLKQRMPFDGSGGAFDRQATVLNRMLDQIEALMMQLRQISADVAHDLRVPLGLLRGKLLVMSEQGVGQISAEDIEAAVLQSDRIIALFAAILRISEVESGSRREAFAPVDLRKLIGDVATTFAPIAEGQRKSLLMDESDAATIEGDVELISQAVINLVENALKYTEVGTCITLQVQRRAAHAVLTVRDDGPGIAMADRDTALRRFGRLDGSRSKAGHGLGLSLVTTIARAHGGDLALGDANPGLVTTLRFPI
jgi:signal transduction histidine kinase